MPAPHDLDPAAMTEEERLGKRRYQAYHAFETMPATRKRSDHFHLGAFGYFPGEMETVWDDRGSDEGDADAGDVGGGE